MSVIRDINNINLRNFTDGTTYTINGSVSETIVGSIFVPGNTFRANDWLMLDTCFERTSGTGTTTCRLRWNTSLSTTNAIQIGTASNTLVIGTAVPYTEMSKKLSIRTANGGGSGISLGTEVTGTGTTTRNEYAASATVNNLPINWTTDSYIFTTMQNSDTAVVFKQHFLKIWTY